MVLSKFQFEIDLELMLWLIPGRLKGYTIVGPDALVEAVWHGKNFRYEPGAEHGVVTNNFFGIFQFLRASIYRTTAPIDGREAFAIDYGNEIFAFVMIDFLRNVQHNLYLGFVAIRGFEKIPIGFFLLESNWVSQSIFIFFTIWPIDVNRKPEYNNKPTTTRKKILDEDDKQVS